MDIPKPTAEREQTDDSLRDERDKSDRAIADGRDLVAEVADEVVRRARIEADAVLLEARDKADRLRDRDHALPATALAVEKERRVEDAAVRDDREAADETLEFERVETTRLLARLLPKEREQTDGHLEAERVRADAALANRDDFLGLVAHDLRDLLSGIALGAAVIGKTVEQNQPAGCLAAEVGRIQRHTARANRLIGDLVDVASIDAGRLQVIVAPGDLSALLAEVADEFRASAAAKGIELSVDSDPGRTAGAFDHARLFQVLGNIVSNAIKFSPRGTRITLSGECRDGELRCSVSDEGPGIPADRTEQVFERFVQVAENDRRGLGLGLFIAKRIIESHSGRIWADSTLGHGTRVSFTIPGQSA